jgi:hypothetical protein
MWFLAWLACSTPEPTPEPAAKESVFSLVYTANVHGEIEPCG